MADNPEPIEVSIIAKIQGLLDGLGQATSGVKHSTEEMQGAFKGLGATIENLKTPFIAITALLAGGALFKEAINGTVEWALEANKLSKVLNTSVQDASTWAVALHTLGIPADSLAGIIARLQTRVTASSDAFKKWGVETKNAEGGALPMAEVIQGMATKYQGLNTDQEKNAMLQELAGRGWINMLPVMRLTTERMEEARKEAAELHLVVGPEGVAKTREYQESMRKLGLIAQSLQIQIGDALLPSLTQLGKWFGEVGPGLAMVLSNAIKGIVTAFFTLKFIIEMTVAWITDFFEKAVNGFKTVGAVIAAAVKGDWEGVKRAAIAGAEEHERIQQESVAITKDLWETLGEDLDKIWSNQGPGAGKPVADAPPPPAADKSRVAEWQAELDKQKAMLAQNEGDLSQMAEAAERDFWAKKLAQAKKGSDEWVVVRLKMAALGISIDKTEKDEIEKIRQELADDEKKRVTEGLAMAKIRATQKINNARAELASEKETADNLLAMGQITAAKRLAMDVDFRKKELALEIQALTEEQGQEGMTLVKWQELQAKKVAASQKAANDIQKTNDAMLQEQRNRFNQWFEMLTSGFQNAISGLVKGTMTWGQALKSVLSSALDGVINFFVQWGLKEAETYLAGLLLKKTTNTAEVLGSASLYAVNAMASVAAIPVVGWSMAPGVGAAAFAEGMSFMPSAAGGWDSVPRDTYAKIHEKEMVLSAPISEGLRNIISTGGAGAVGDVHAHFHGVVDAKTFFQKNQASIVRTLSDAVKKRRHG